MSEAERARVRELAVYTLCAGEVTRTGQVSLRQLLCMRGDTDCICMWGFYSGRTSSRSVGRRHQLRPPLTLFFLL